jgi:ribosome-associated protein
MPTKPKKKTASATTARRAKPSAASRVKPPAPSRAEPPVASHVEPPTLLIDLVRALDAKKAEDLRVLHVGGVSTITDWLVMANGGSEPHLRALRIETERVLDAAAAPIAGTDGGQPGSGWTVVDAYQIMVHVFTAEQRVNYALERLWRDAEEVPVAALLAPPTPAPKPRAPRKSPARRVVAAKTKPRAKAR